MFLLGSVSDSEYNGGGLFSAEVYEARQLLNDFYCQAPDAVVLHFSALGHHYASKRLLFPYLAFSYLFVSVSNAVPWF